MPKPTREAEAVAGDQPSLATGKGAPPLTEMLVRWKAGDQLALTELMPAVYDELRRAVRRRLCRERPDHTFQSAALVNEMYMRMLLQKPFGTENRLHLFMVASRLMRQILVDHARSHGAQNVARNTTAGSIPPSCCPKHKVSMSWRCMTR